MNPQPSETTSVSVLANRLLKAGPPSPATSVAVGGSSVVVVRENLKRSSLVLINTHATQWVSFYLAVIGEQDVPVAVLYSGITLAPNGGVWEMDAQTFTLGAIYGIASGANTTVAIQEFGSYPSAN